MGVATCDKGLPAMMMALASQRDLPTILVPGGVMLAGETENEDTAKVQSIGARYAHGEITLEQAAEAGCHACACPGGGCQFLGTAATSQVVGEALGLDAAALGARAVGSADLARHGAPLGPRAGEHVESRDHDAAHPHGSGVPERDGRLRGVRRQHESAAAHAGRSPSTPASSGRPSTTGPSSTAACRGSSMRCRTARSAIRRSACSSPAACRK